MAKRRIGIAFGLAMSACSQKELPPPPPPPPPTAPASSPVGAAPAAADGAPFTGEVRLGEGIGPDQLRPTDVLYVMARACAGDCAHPGSLIAVHRVPAATFPIKYAIGPAQLMMQGAPFTGPFVVQARLDRDGDPMTKGPEDLYAEVLTGVLPGQDKVDLPLGRTPSTLPAGAPAAPMGHGGMPPGHGGGAPPPKEGTGH